MKYNLHEQMTPFDRAYNLLNKYPLWYVKDSVNGIIKVTRKNDETEICNYWNEVATEIKSLINKYKICD